MDQLRVQLSVIGALVLRDVGTRFGRRPTGYLMVLVMPLGTFMLTAGVWILLKRQTPIGSSQWIFFATGLLPYLVWTFPYRQIAVAVNVNRPLLYFSRVKVVDIMVARSLLEVLTGFVVVMVVVAALNIAGETVEPRDAFMSFMALSASMYFGVAWGMLNGLIASVYPVWNNPMMLFSPLMWALSGAGFMVETIPSPWKEYLSFNPVLQCVEWLRESYYWEYKSSVLDRFYVLGLSTAVIAFVLFAERRVRGRILQG